MMQSVGRSHHPRIIELEEHLAHELLLLHLQESFAILTPVQARRLHARYLLSMRVKDIAAIEGVSRPQVSDSIRGALKRLNKHFKKQKWI